MAKHHPDLIFCRKQSGVAIGRLCEKCDGRCVICDSYVRPTTLVRICDECNYGSYQGRCVICGGPGVSDAYYCRECTITEKDRDGCPKIVNLGSAKTDLFYERKKFGFKKQEKKKRKVTFKEVDEGNKKQKQNQTTQDTRLHSGKYTLDSDEDDDDDDQGNEKEMNQDNLEEIGQERATIGFDDDVKITPFNIDEELEDGHYDETGCFQWKKKDDVHDAWLDEIDWTNVKNYKLKNPQATDEDPNNSTTDIRPEEDEEETDEIEFNEANTIRSMLVLMQPGESVVRTIKRLGAAIANNKPKQQGKQRKLLPGEVPKPAAIEQTPEELKKNKLLLEEMSGLANQFVSNGEADIYQETYERLKSKLDRLQSSTTSKVTTSTFDMFGDSDISTSINKPTTETKPSSEVLWEYTTNENIPGDLQGPFTTEQMVRLTEMEGKLDKEKVRCRRIGTEQFYSIKRIDFDLYLD
ncbi:hypothetical protein I4U23_000413 [Adineta vaga]|nr:hypothetical protein I4U23_000413 [Adineta vaga]